VGTPQYALGSDDTELERLQTQASMLAEPTALLLQRGGIRPGMRVLDLGSGPGDVSFLVADLVGVDGSVLGVEQDPAQLATAERRRAERGLANVAFQPGDARTFLTSEPFDAVVCRLLLMHLPAPETVLAHHLRNLRPGGVFVAVDYDAGGVRSLPEVDLFTQVGAWVLAGFEHAGIDATVGMRLPALFGQAGYRNVGALGLQMYWPPGQGQAASYLVGVARAAEDAILASGVVTADELGLDTLDRRLAEALDAAGAVWTTPTVVGGWGSAPAD
jgi:SAM-dependent methyltransferase